MLFSSFRRIVFDLLRDFESSLEHYPYLMLVLDHYAVEYLSDYSVGTLTPQNLKTPLEALIQAIFFVKKFVLRYCNSLGIIWGGSDMQCEFPLQNPKMPRAFTSRTHI